MLMNAIWKCNLETVYDLNSRYHQMEGMETWVILLKPAGFFFKSFSYVEDK